MLYIAILANNEIGDDGIKEISNQFSGISSSLTKLDICIHTLQLKNS